jgi:hypothetical protein
MLRRALLSLALVATMACSDRSDREQAQPASPPTPSPELVRVDTGVARPTDSLADSSAGPATSPVEETPPTVATAPEPRVRHPSRPRPRPQPPAYREPAPDTLPDTVRVTDTVPDTVRVADTVRVSDTVRVPDTVTDSIGRSNVGRVADTASVPDTVTRADTTSRADTVSAAGAPGADTARAVPDSAVAGSSSPSRSTANPSPTVAAPGAVASSARGTRSLPAGTEIHIALDDSISSRHDSAGTAVSAEVMQAVKDAGGAIVVPAGARVRLTVTRLAPARSRSAADGEIALRVDGIVIGDSTIPVKARVSQIPHELKGRGVTGSEAAKVGVGAAAGAVAGRVIGGDAKGAVIGGVVGAAGGAAVATQTASRDVVVAPRTAISFVLEAPLVAAVPERESR